VNEKNDNDSKDEKEEEIMKHLPKSFQLLARLIDEVDEEIRQKKGKIARNKPKGEAL
jgi:hypothetical protein